MRFAQAPIRVLVAAGSYNRSVGLDVAEKAG